MDLRAQRTRRSIINAFIELRAKKPIEKITVRELSEKALINKATFYQHFEDIYALSEALEDEAIDTVFKSIPHADSLIENPKEGCIEFMQALTSQSEFVNILFSGSRRPLLMEKLEPKIKKAIFLNHPEYENDLEKEILLTLLIQGSANAFPLYQNQDPQIVIRILGEISECLITAFIRGR